MNCKQANEVFADSLAGHLDESLRAELDSHLGGCAACREEQRSLHVLWTKLSSMPSVEPDPAAGTRFQALLSAYRAGLDHAGSRSAPYSGLSDWLRQWWPKQVAWQ